MKIILLKEVKGRGGEGDIIEVKDGYANNYLLRYGYAVKATQGNLRQLEERRQNIEKREETRIAEANELKEKINGLKFKADVQIGDEGQLFGAVTAQMIADGIKKHADVEIDKRRIDVRKAIKTVGLHKAEVTIYRDIKAEIEIIVGSENAEKFLEDLKNKKDSKSKRNSDRSNKSQEENKEEQEIKSEEVVETAEQAENAVEANDNNDNTEAQPKEQTDEQNAE